MAKFIVKEFSIKEDINLKSLELIKTELKKYVIDLELTISLKSGNKAYWESQEFNLNNLQYGITPEKLEQFIKNTLNFRYENFQVDYLTN
jgi:hypothetical protein